MDRLWTTGMNSALCRQDALAGTLAGPASSTTFQTPQELVNQPCGTLGAGMYVAESYGRAQGCVSCGSRAERALNPQVALHTLLLEDREPAVSGTSVRCLGDGTSRRRTGFHVSTPPPPHHSWLSSSSWQEDMAAVR
ncbi:hypothetical protein DPEC_G00369400 [Dallia pectoralis]|nr:hypothetical protein DPEC_G00369400 [Dallia pectoralis]